MILQPFSHPVVEILGFWALAPSRELADFYDTREDGNC